MKLKIVTLLLVVMILIFQLPAFANDEMPEPPEQPHEVWQYWLIYEYSNNIQFVYSTEPITVTTDEERLIVNSYHIYILTGNGWEHERFNTVEIRLAFDSIYKASHDIAYEDGSGFFFRAELPEQDDEGDGFWENLEEFFSWFNPDNWLHNIIDGVTESVGLLTEPIERIINFLNPLHEDFFLRVAFIPSAGYMEEFRTDIKAIFDNKFSFINEIRDFLAFIFSSPIIDNPGPPKFEVTLPGGKWGSGSIQVIDFSMFADYRIYIINFIRVFLWIPFLIKLYKRLPSVVY